MEISDSLGGLVPVPVRYPMQLPLTELKLLVDVSLPPTEGMRPEPGAQDEQ